jgi:predicted negative regulator of RcsB-dependent stress response
MGKRWQRRGCGTAPTEHKERDPVVRIVEWINKNQRTLIVVAVVVVGSIAAIMYMRVAGARKENFANSLLSNARAVAASGNAALAITDLSDLVMSYRGTIAAEEGEVLLARLRLSEGQSEAAVQALQNYIARGPSDQFRAAAYGLLGGALEQTANFADAAEAYETAAAEAWYDFLSAQYLLDAGRALVEAGDSSRAIATYQRILDDLSETDMAMEARLRLGELQRADIDNR